METIRPIELNGIAVVVGNYGSGKTEVTVNLAVHCRKDGLDVRVADLDLVNPYFRTREARSQLAQMDIEVILPPERYLQADLPILTPRVSGLIRQPGQLTLIDVGGDDAGATVLASLADAFGQSPYTMLQVVNPHRPYASTVEGCLKIRRDIESAAGMKITGLIGNANLIDETTVDDIINGYAFVKQLAEASGLPLVFITAESRFLPRLASRSIACPILPIDRQLVPPWIKARPFSRSPAHLSD